MYNRTMTKYLILTLTLIGSTLLYMYFWIGVPNIYQESPSPLTKLHIYRNPDVSIAKIDILAFYFVPKNRVESTLENWQEILEKNLKKLREFHSLQVQGGSRLVYKIYPEPIIGREDSRVYDTDITQHGNPEGLRRVARELEQRVFEKGGDRYEESFVKTDSDSYRVWMVMYEGVGASGSDNVAFVSSKFLVGEEYNDVASSLFSHEFYHTLGLPDGYDIDTGIPVTQDLMGFGRNKPLEKTYLDREFLKGLGP